jgi:predicted DNA-binding transcriptional regulator YafY
MSKRAYISRYLLIIKKLKNTPYSTYEALHSYLIHAFAYLQMQDESLEIHFSKRTLQRDLKEIRDVFGIDIAYDTSKKGYYIADNAHENMNFQRMMEALDLFNALNCSKDLLPFIHFEKQMPHETEKMYGLLFAIKNRRQITFTYWKFWHEEVEDEKSERCVEPYALKEYKNRWYILAKPIRESSIKSFALDRMSNLLVSRQTYCFPNPNPIEESYRYRFGISGGDSGEVQDIILSFDPYQGNYIKTLPLHNTQEILIDNAEELRIKLTLYPSFELRMELLSFGNRMKVLAPESLVNEIKKEHREAYKQYQTKD